MSLLSRGRETVVVFPEETYSDKDGNLMTRASSVGVVCKATLQPLTSAAAVGAKEKQDTGFYTESKYRLRLVGYPHLLGAQSQVEWQNKRYSIEGEARQYNGSNRTRHTDYVIVRS